ncbi:MULTISPECIES: TadE/TadG family type IV pilus assembly protein [Comamonas]|uniref:Flp pilus assembly protein TadG n=1 Tax=Comamonas testosteroni TaxID=285 RepID=A0A8B4S5I4_COMTE|nr:MULTISPECIES: TadE/TadG family type IV pilus assembly protein [Comamonas]EHN63935.1 TadE-like protein [Comamonas testosteroni ATCC 11996]QQN69095.1 pilus assembly protein [Comamonas testosteroni]RDI15189.1 TadE-like protein [Comamonas sp. AG1104]SUY77545.1 Flp pilus assembly protein TadG [Comamonas testosteroni]
MRKYQHRQQGAALIELALSIPFMIMLSMIVIEFGRALYEYNTVTKSVRDAARYLSANTPNTLCPDAQNLVVYGTTTAGSQPLAPGLKTSAVSCSWQTTGALPLINTVTVTVTGYHFSSPISSVFGLQLFTNGGINFGNITATMRTLT